MKIAICASEVVPFAKTGGLADVTGALALALEELKHEVVILMPKYKSIQDSKYRIKGLKNDISYTLAGKGVKVYFIESDAYFNRDEIYGDKKGDCPDNLERFSYYCRRSIALLKELNFKPDIVHVHDWQASLIPVYLKTLFNDDRFFKGTRSLLTIHNLGYQGLFVKEEFPKLGLDWDLFSLEGLEFYGRINLLKGGILFSDMINTVSPTYAKEIRTKEFGFGLEGVLTERQGRLHGILNGVDYSIWDPKTDKYIARNFEAKNLEGKAEDKKDLQKYCGLPLEKETPLVGMVSRLAEPKGFDIIGKGIEKICKLGLQLVILGTGDARYHALLEAMAGKYPKVVSVHLGFDDPLAHKIYAGSDIFLMPSNYEPCGLGQIISLKYGSIPVVFKTGGLADTVKKDYGFIFDEYSKDALVAVIREAVDVYKNKKSWNTLVNKAMDCDFSWQESAKRYVELYEKAKAC